METVRTVSPFTLMCDALDLAYPFHAWVIKPTLRASSSLKVSECVEQEPDLGLFESTLTWLYSVS